MGGATSSLAAPPPTSSLSFEQEDNPQTLRQNQKGSIWKDIKNVSWSDRSDLRGSSDVEERTQEPECGNNLRLLLVSCLNTSGTELLNEFNITKISNSIRFRKKLYLPHALIATVFILAKLMQVG